MARHSQHGWNISRNLDIQYSKVFLHWLVGSWRRRTRKPHTSMRILREPAEQSQDGVWKSDEKPPKSIKDEMLKEVQPKEVSSLAKAPRNVQLAAGNSLREVQQKFETLGTDVPIYKNLSRSGIHPWGCCRKIPQSSLKCGSWFPRSNSCMQRVYKFSCGRWFQNRCCDWTKNNYWTSASSSYSKKSW